MEPHCTPDSPTSDQPESAPHRCPLSPADCPLPTADCRLLLDPAASGAWNMAVDEWLMEWSAASGQYGWRLYAWQEPTLSLGYFQAYEDRQGHAASLDCPAVRRPSGGGAIVHDLELTYSFAAPCGSRLARRRRGLYEAVHATLIEVLSREGIAASLCEGSNDTEGGGPPFLCFLRRAPGDVLVGETKIAGSAQRRSAGAVLQHGSVLLARSPAAPELPGINDLVETPLGPNELAEPWLEALGVRLGLAWQDRPLGPEERRRVADLVAAKYGTEAWTLHRGRSPRSRSRAGST